METHGIWEMENDFMGGPFVNMAIVNEEKGTLLNPGKTEKEFPRAFEMLSPMQRKEEDYFLSLAILELAMRNISEK